MATISKKAAKRINELLAEASSYNALKGMIKGDGGENYWRCSLKEGLAVRALFDEFGIEADRFFWFTEDKIKELKIRVADIEAERAA